MGLGGCIILIAVGAILAFATDWKTEGLNVTVAGLVMMAVGIIGVAAFTSIARRRRAVPPVQTTVVEPDRDRHDY
ncbi:DUF6458 family protein [Streptomyces sp. NPDC052114]|uniref:DUF6458 family protein n=1 Tax=unclassified Streptomyces TaxID=2593676 RepID=UPI00344221CA